MEAVSVGRMARQRIAGMDEIRHLVHRLLKLQQKTGTEEELTRVRHKLNQTYDAYVKRYGHLINMGNQGFPGGCRLSVAVCLRDRGKGSRPESGYFLSLHHAQTGSGHKGGFFSGHHQFELKPVWKNQSAVHGRTGAKRG